MPSSPFLRRNWRSGIDGVLGELACCLAADTSRLPEEEPEVCDMCCGRRGHRCLRVAMFNAMNARYKEARLEYERLLRLYEDVVWYSTECQMRHWRQPWPVTYPFSSLVLFGRHYANHTPSRPQLSVWYSGPAAQAPELPIEILLTELRDAAELAEDLSARRVDAFAYAPGGPGYEDVKRHWYVNK